MKHRLHLRSALLLVSALGSPSTGMALPRFAAREGFSCAVCHTNPTGGGMRNGYGRVDFEKAKLSLLTQDGAPLGAHHFDPQPTEWLSLGADARFMGLYIPAHGSKGEQAAFFPMQADIYLRADVSQAVTLYHDQGALGSFETMALIKLGEGKGPDGNFSYFKLGKFVPPFGTKLDNHTAFIREPFGFPPTGKDGGVEVGIYPKDFSIILAATNGDLVESSNLDPDTGKMITLRMDHRFALGPAKFTTGSSQLLNFPRIEVDGGKKTSTNFKAGGFLYASLGRLHFVGEADVGHECIPPAQKLGGVKLKLQERLCQDGLSLKRSLVSYGELGLVPRQGIEVLLTHEYFDPDLEISPSPAEGATTGDIDKLPVALQRIGIGVEVFPTHYFELRLLLRRQTPTGGGPAAVSEKATSEILFMSHLFF